MLVLKRPPASFNVENKSQSGTSKTDLLTSPRSCYHSAHPLCKSSAGFPMGSDSMWRRVSTGLALAFVAGCLFFTSGCQSGGGVFNGGSWLSDWGNRPPAGQSEPDLSFSDAN
ncbi:MAG: hypothetical protein ACE5KM_05095 [Planctomycetaceae bacterium]